MQKLIVCFLWVLFGAACATQKNSAPVSSRARQDQDQMKAFMEAEVFRLNGDHTNALKLYTKFVQSYPEIAVARFNLARLQQKKMALSEANDQAVVAVKLQPNNMHFRMLLAQIQVSSHRYHDALDTYEELIKRWPRNESLLYEKAMIQQALRKYKDAIVTLNQLETLVGFDEDIIMHKKNLYLQLNNTSDALKELQRLADEDHSTPKYELLMADVYRQNGDTEQEAAAYQRIERKFPQDAMAQVALAGYYSRKKNKEKYQQFLEQLVLNPHLETDAKMGLIMPLLRQSEKDLEDRNLLMGLLRSLSEKPDAGPDVLSLYADALYIDKQYAEALVQYKRFLDSDTNKLGIWLQMMNLYLERQMTDSVIHTARRCVAIFPQEPLVFFYGGLSLMQQRKADSAIHWLSRVIDLEKKNLPLIAQTWSALGDAYNTIKQYHQSDSCFEEALSLQPEEATTLNNYAYYLSLRKVELAKADSMSKKSLEIQPGSKSFLDTYGWILFQQGKFEDARDYIQKAIDADGQQDGTLFEHMGDVLYKLDQDSKALEYWLRARELGEQSPTLEQKIQLKKYVE